MLNKKVISYLFILIFINSCSAIEDYKMKKDADTAKEYISQFKHGMTINEVIIILKQKRKDTETYNLCSQRFEASITYCKDGYTVMGGHVLPYQNQLQIYFTFNDKEFLIHHNYELFQKPRNNL